MEPDKNRRREMAQALASFKMRAHYIAHIAGVSERSAKLIYREVNGKSSPSGLGPDSTTWYFSPRARIHATLFLRFYIPAKKKGMSDAEAFINAYSYYRAAAIHSVEMSPERAYFLTKLYGSGGHIQLTRCRGCATRYITAKNEVRSSFQCPVCYGRMDASVTLRKAFKARAQANSAALAN